MAFAPGRRSYTHEHSNGQSGMISFGMLRDVWAFRGFMAGSIKREFLSVLLGLN